MADLRFTPDSLALDEARAPCVVDPVCGQELDLDRAAAQEDHEGWAYFFCSHRCQELFAADPGRFAGTAPSLNDGGPR
jgi:Cu+-exporting ATPase